MADNKAHKSDETNETNRYNHRAIEPKWEKKWDEAGIYKAVDFDKKPKKYVLVEFPYPSGARLHVGHGRSYTALDAMARKFRMQGFNVMFPMGWDAFGLPTENYAIKNKVNPNVVVKENIAHAKAQAKRWGLSVDWDREIDTTDPKYYKWTQWIFVQLFKKGLAYRSEVAVNWCPFCKTNLANEEVLSDGTHERCGNKTERRMQKQWILKITKYADRLLEDLKTVGYLPKIANQQINWIGRSEGAQIEFKVQPFDFARGKSAKFKTDKEEFITVFTTRPDTLYGATFMVISPEHELVKKILEGQDGQGGLEGQEIRKYIERAKMKTELERIEETKNKTGIFSGLYAINPATEKEIPIWISDFVLSSYGAGAIMAVPAHDGRDFAFAKKFGLPITRVIGEDGENRENKGEELPYCEAKGVLINSGDWNGLKVPEEMGKIIFWLEKKGIGKKEVSYHLRDWVFSRQHYWGEPIPMIFCEKCKSEGQGGIGGSEGLEMAGWWPVPEEQLPVELPYLEQYEPSGTGESPLSKVESWVNTKCPHCGGPAKRETDTMPNWAGSNWYFVAYPLGNKLRVQSEQGNIFSENKDLLSYWLPVDLYNGGMEHTTLHLLYSRFIYKFLFDIGVVPTSEPYAKRRSHGMVLGPDGQKMSKSRGNVINPDEIVEAFGADTFRLYESFMGPFDQVIAWSPESLEGCYRFLKRVWGLVADGKWEARSGKLDEEVGSEKLERKLNQTIKKVGEDIAAMKFNTAVAAMMELLNEMDKGDKKDKTDKGMIEKFLLILAPFAPHITEELWEKLGNSFSIHEQKWPEYDPNLAVEDIVTIAVQVNGKLRGTIELPIANCNTSTSSVLSRAKSRDKLQDEVERMAKENEKVKKYLEGPSFAKATAGKQEIKKTIYIPGKLINFVI